MATLFQLFRCVASLLLRRILRALSRFLATRQRRRERAEHESAFAVAVFATKTQESNLDAMMMMMEEEVFGGEREMRTSHTNTNATTTHRSKRGRRKKRDILLACGSLLLFSNTSSSQKEEEAFAAGMMDFTKQSQSTFQLGPLQVTLQRLRTLRNDIFTSLEEEEGKEGKKNEDDTGVVVVKPGSEEAIARLRNATLDCTSARPALEAYANVRDVCTLSIVLKSVSKKFATEEARERARERKDETVQAFAELERKLRDVNASKEDIDAEFENSRASVKRFAESVLEAFDFSDEEEKVKREAFPDLFS